MQKSILLGLLFVIPLCNGFSQTVLIGKGEHAKIIQAKDFEAENFDLESAIEEIKKSIKVKSQDLDQSASTKKCLKEESVRAQNVCFSRFLSSLISKDFDDNTIATPGKYKISVRCKIDADGNIVFALVDGPTPESELSAINALKKIEGIIPANYKGENVEALVAFPIIGLKR